MQPRMRPLVDYRNYLLRRKPDMFISHFDPEDGGARAELLFLLTHVDGDPGLEKNGSRFISKENDDPTARNFSKVIEILGLKRSAFVIWNVVPWQGGDPLKDANDGASYLPKLVKALPELRGIAVLSMEGRIRKAVEKELLHVRGVEKRFTSNPGPQSYIHRAGALTESLRNFASRLSLID